MVTAIDGHGTSEAVWSAWAPWAWWPALPQVHRPLVVAPHPDDEILGAAGLLALAGGDVVAVTDGEASHPGSTVLTTAELVAVRQAETTVALAELGRPGTIVTRLGHPDGGIDEALLEAQLVGLLEAGRWCVSTWRGDGHPDHEAVGRAAARACLTTGARLLEYPVWTWHWAEPDDRRVPWDRAYRLDLPDPMRHAKASAIAAFRSQVAPLGPDPADAAILPPHVVARFLRPFEVFFG